MGDVDKADSSAVRGASFVRVALVAEIIYKPAITFIHQLTGTPTMTSLDSFKCRKKLTVGAKTYHYFSLKAAERNGLEGISALPYSMKILLENLLRFEDGRSVTKEDIAACAAWLVNKGTTEKEIAFRPSRVLMQDFTGVPAVVDLAAMRDAMTELGGDPDKINPLVPVDLVIDHSVIVDEFGSAKAFKKNVELEYQRNGERYRFLKWGQGAFDNFRVVPPGTGICHQVNLEYLAQTVWTRKEKHVPARGKPETVDVAYPDSLVGTDSHTTMVNGLSVLGWGVGGIEAEACMLGQPLSMLLPEVVGFHLTGALKEGVTATDLVLTVTQMLRKKGVVGKFVEFYGPGLDHLALADRATVANMAPEYGATCGFFPVDAETIAYLTMSGRTNARIALVEKYAKAQGLFRTRTSPDPVFTETLDLDLSTVVPSLAGPKRPEGRVSLETVGTGFVTALAERIQEARRGGQALSRRRPQFRSRAWRRGDRRDHVLHQYVESERPHRGGAARAQRGGQGPAHQAVGEDVAGAGFPGRRRISRQCRLAEGSRQARFQSRRLRLHDLHRQFRSARRRDLQGDQRQRDRRRRGAVGQSQFRRPGEPGHAGQLSRLAAARRRLCAGRQHDEGSDQRAARRGQAGQSGLPARYLAVRPRKSICSSQRNVTKKIFKERYADVFNGDINWRRVKVPQGTTYKWDIGSTYVRNPPYFEGMTMTPPPVADIVEARILALFGDKITTDHISPAGSIKLASPAGRWLSEHQVAQADFNQYGTRRGNHEVMMRGTFANIRIKNFMLKGADGNVPEGGNTKHYPDGEAMSIYDAAMKYQAENVPLVVFAGEEYGNGSSRDWAAKGTRLLGVRAVIARSFERIHRSNLVGMGILPLTFEEGTSWQSLGIDRR